MQLRQIIKQRRKQLNITQEDLARKISVSTNTINNFETGKNQLGSGSIDKILEILKIKFVYKKSLLKRLF